MFSILGGLSIVGVGSRASRVFGSRCSVIGMESDMKLGYDHCLWLMCIKHC